MKSLLQRIIFGTEFDESPLLSAQFLVLIEEHDGLSIERLSDMAGLPLSTTLRVVSGLKKGKNSPFVKTVVLLKGQKRETYVSITPSGKEYLVSLENEKLS